MKSLYLIMTICCLFLSQNLLGLENNGAYHLLHFLSQTGITKVYGLPGAATKPFDWAFAADRIPQIPSDRAFYLDVNYYLITNEEMLGAIAGAYGKISKNVGVFCTTEGPGVALSINGILQANLEGLPVISIHGTSPISEFTPGSFQYFEMEKVLPPIVKKFFLVKDATELKKILPEAYLIAKYGTPKSPGAGCVSIILPDNVQKQLLPVDFAIEKPLPSFEEQFLMKENDGKTTRIVLDFIKNLEKAKKPIIVAGYGCFLEDSCQLLEELATLLQIPVVSSWEGKGVFDEGDPLSFGQGGSLGQDAANAATYFSDFVLELGNKSYNLGEDYEAKFNLFYSSDSHKYIVNLSPINEKAYRTSSNYKNSHFLSYNTHIFLKKLNEVLKQKNLTSLRNNYQDWRNFLFERKEFFAKHPLYSFDQDTTQGISLPFAIKTIRDSIPEVDHNGVLHNAILTTGVGLHWYCVSQFFKYSSPFNILTSYIHASIGCAIPYAIGAYDADNSKKIYVIEGDGGLLQSISYLCSAADRKIPLTIFLINDALYGAVWFSQKNSFQGRWTNHVITDPINWRKICESVNVSYFEVSNKEDLSTTLKKAISRTDITLVNIKTIKSNVVLRNLTDEYIVYLNPAK